MKRVKFITCIFSNLHGTRWGGRPNRWSHYRYSLLSLLKMTNADFICYTSKDEFSELEEFFYKRNNISKDQLKLVEWNLGDTKHLAQIHEIKNFDSARRGDRCVEIQYSKFYWWWNEDNSYDYYYWIDAGLSHVGLIPPKYLTSSHIEARYYESSIFDNHFLDKLLEISEDKFLIIGKENRRNFWSSTIDRKHYKKYDDTYHIIGGLFGGKKELWTDIVNKFDNYLKTLLYQDREIYHEELIMSLMFRNDEDMFKMLPFDTWWHKESAPQGLKNTYFEENKSFYIVLEDILNFQKQSQIPIKDKKNVIAFSLWGNNYRYLGGALQNVELAKHFYPGWICRFYVGNSTRKDFVEKLKSFDNVEVIEKEEDGDWTGMLWRFHAAADPQVNVMLSRDCDSRIHRREVEAVKEWLTSEKDFHIMRDHQYHGVPILGGMWGAKNGILNDIVDKCQNYKAGNFWQTDQNFLRDIIFNDVADKSLVHDEIHRIKVDSHRYPQSSGPRHDDHFIGQAYAGDGKVLDNDPRFTDYIKEVEGLEINVYDEYKN